MLSQLYVYADPRKAQLFIYFCGIEGEFRCGCAGNLLVTNRSKDSLIFRFLLAINTQCAVIDMQIILNDILHDL